MGSVLESAKEYRFPQQILGMVLAIYGSPRTLHWRGMNSSAIEVGGTVIPGCALAVTMMRLALQRVLEEVMAEPSLTQVWPVQVVDDISLTATGTREQVAESLTRVGKVLLGGLTRARLPVSLVKSVVISSCQRLSRRIANALELPVATHAQHLGREVRIRRAVQLRKKGAKIAALLRTKPVATGTWGIATDGVTGLQLNSFRCKVVRAARRLPARAAPLLHMQSDASLAKVDPAIAVHAT
eukprot:560267-Amphidinium_carterae.2